MHQAGSSLPFFRIYKSKLQGMIVLVPSSHSSEIKTSFEASARPQVCWSSSCCCLFSPQSPAFGANAPFSRVLQGIRQVLCTKSRKNHPKSVSTRFKSSDPFLDETSLNSLTYLADWQSCFWIHLVNATYPGGQGEFSGNSVKKRTETRKLQNMTQS